MCGHGARKRALFKQLGAKTNLPMGIIMINHVKRNHSSSEFIWVISDVTQAALIDSSTGGEMTNDLSC